MATIPHKIASESANHPGVSLARISYTIARCALATWLGIGLVAGIPVSAAPPAGGDYEKEIRPLFSERCAECHSDEERSSGFSVATPASIFAGGDKYGQAVVAGSPEASPLLQVLQGHKKPRMPMGERLSDEEIGRVESWIRGLEPEETLAVESEEWRWPYERPTKGEPPTVERRDWVRNPVDAFLLKKLEEAELEPAPEAPKRTLARRVYLDLVGVPPTPEELAAYVEAESLNAYEALIDKLLADPRYGERWGRHWLDLVRYGETSGLEGDGAIGNAWRYRDWVIDAFNRDIAYDRFVTLQLAGADSTTRPGSISAGRPGAHPHRVPPAGALGPLEPRGG
jgi:mono/diheme cytochrome c family protein